MALLSFALKLPLSGSVLRKKFSTVPRPVKTCGLLFKNPVGLAAGFDKNAVYLSELEALGFGFVEVGTVTPLPQSGNKRPRLFRLPEDRAIINRMGFNNDGAGKVAERLAEWKKKDSDLVIGVNIGKNKSTPNEEAWLDYEKCFLKLHPYADYIVVNVSSPNTPGLRDLQQVSVLNTLLCNLIKLNKELVVPRPLFLKLSPDTDIETFDGILTLCAEIKLDGVIISNTTISRAGLISPAEKIENAGNGGLSGKPLKDKSTELVKHAHQKIGSEMVIIASGGIFSADDAQEKLNAGATLIQVWTGFVYEGPAIAKKIVQGLSA